MFDPGYVQMKKEYDFSKGARGKFFRENVRLDLPVIRISAALPSGTSKVEGVEVARLVNGMFRAPRDGR